jgi:hypothetical protein
VGELKKITELGFFRVKIISFREKKIFGCDFNLGKNRNLVIFFTWSGLPNQGHGLSQKLIIKNLVILKDNQGVLPKNKYPRNFLGAIIAKTVGKFSLKFGKANQNSQAILRSLMISSKFRSQEAKNPDKYWLKG